MLGIGALAAAWISYGELKLSMLLGIKPNNR
jgi:hypothetical protein